MKIDAASIIFRRARTKGRNTRRCYRRRRRRLTTQTPTAAAGARNVGVEIYRRSNGGGLAKGALIEHRTSKDDKKDKTDGGEIKYGQIGFDITIITNSILSFT